MCLVCSLIALVAADHPVEEYAGQVVCKCFLEDLQKSLPAAMTSHLDDVPMASNYVIENSFQNGSMVGTVFEECARFAPSTTSLRAHLALLGVTDRCALLVEAGWLV